MDAITGIHAQKENQLEHWTFTRLYDTGVIELVVSISGNELNGVPATALRALADILPIIEKLELQGRCLVSLDVLRAKGTTISSKGLMRIRGRTGRVIEKADLHPQPAIVEAPKPADAPAILRPALLGYGRRPASRAAGTSMTTRSGRKYSEPRTPRHTTLLLRPAPSCTLKRLNLQGTQDRDLLAKVDVEGSNPFSRSN